ncbi:MAG: hypothetical protein IKX23_04950 [Treponema sp.]|nr:hypothetical protein [Treponema sp.]
MKKINFIVLFLLALFIVSCKAKREEKIILDNSEPLALVPDVSWALITDPYAAYRKDYNWESENVGHCRRGEILRVVGKSIDQDNFEWYLFEEGWLPSSCLTVYSNRYKAVNAAKSFKD